MSVLDRLRKIGGPARGALRGAGLYGAALGFDTLIALATLSVVTRHVSLETFSEFALFQVVAAPLLPLVDLGCGTAMVREAALTRDPAERGARTATLMGSRVLLAAVVAAAIALLGPVVLPAYAGPLRAAAVTFWLWTTALAAGDALRGVERHGVVALSFIARAILRTAATILFVRAGWGLEGLILGLGASWAVGLAVLVAALWRGPRARPSWAIFRKLVAFGAPAAGYYGLRNLGALDRHLVRATGALGDAGLYQLAATPGQAIDVLEFGGSLAIEPYLFGARANELGTALDRLCRWAALALLGGSIVLGLAGPEILRILGPEIYAPALGAVPWLLFAASLRAIARLVGYGAAPGRQTRAWLMIGLVETVVATALIVLVAGRFGPTGAAVGRFVAAALSVAVGAKLAAGAGSATGAIRRILFVAVAIAAVTAGLATPLGIVAPAWARALAALALLGTTFAIVRPGGPPAR